MTHYTRGDNITDETYATDVKPVTASLSSDAIPPQPVIIEIEALDEYQGESKDPGFPAAA
ncbi:MAG TPA: hypothetical protein VKU01_03105 [Bryobacteraceae bacterium]|nr:hypothetical protein [Bryobacteraceae bacterium]